ncbi:MAG: TonB C-terminal domain-containing protein [Nitrospirae bacterium]|nr:TonB C-terminal domain-containing protein [Nitrospirota bacterium]
MLHLIFIAVTVIPLVHKKKEIKNYYVSLVNPAVIRKVEVPDATRKVTVAEKKVVEKEKKIIPEKKLKEEIKKVEMTTDPTPTLRERIDKKTKEKQEEEDKKRKLRDLAADIKGRVKKTAEVASGSSNPYAGLGDVDARLLYESNVKDYIQSFWKIPKSIDVEGLEAVFDIRVDNAGKIIAFKITKTSNNWVYDRSTQKAMLDASEETKKNPFPEPPSDMREEVIEEGIVFTFKVEE